MIHVRGFLAILRWDIILELRRREAVLNMSLFAVLILFLASYGISSGRPELQEELGPLFLWLAVLFSGTIGLSRAFSVEREGGALTGVLLTSVDPAVLYLAKVAATWLYVMAMEVFAFLAYTVLFNFSRWERLPVLLATLGAFTYAYAAAGITLGALTSALRGGEVVLRILLFPIMIPAIIISLNGSQAIFSTLTAGDPARAVKMCAALFGLGTVYLCAGILLFEKVVEE